MSAGNCFVRHRAATCPSPGSFSCPLSTISRQPWAPIQEVGPRGSTRCHTYFEHCRCIGPFVQSAERRSVQSALRLDIGCVEMQSTFHKRPRMKHTGKCACFIRCWRPCFSRTQDGRIRWRACRPLRVRAPAHQEAKRCWRSAIRVDPWPETPRVPSHAGMDVWVTMTR